VGNPFDINREFEAEICRYTGAPFAVLTNSCTMALRLCLDWQMRQEHSAAAEHGGLDPQLTVTIPRRTYVSVAMQVRAAVFNLAFRDEDWEGYYQLSPFRIWDSARWFTSGMFRMLVSPDKSEAGFVCVSFHSTKTLGLKRVPDEPEDHRVQPPWDIEQGGAILHNSSEADRWFRRARFDGRTEGVAPKDDTFDMIGHHCYLNPSSARLGLELLKRLPKHNAPLPNDDYPDLSLHPVFQR
jgi:hypothetical protein